MKYLTVELLQQIERAGQTAILRFWNELSLIEKSDFAQQLKSVDWRAIGQRRDECLRPQIGLNHSSLTVEPPRQIVRRPQTSTEWSDWEAARKEGQEMLQRHEVGVLLVAGGSGTRLGFHHPKGVYPIGPVSDRSLFQLFAEQIVALTKRYGSSIPLMIMTGESTHDETVEWFEKHGRFGLDPTCVFYFQQGWQPILDATNGSLLLAQKGKLATSADGHGGVLAAMVKTQLFEELRRRKIKTLFYHQVDNPLVHVCDPVFLGFHARRCSQASTKVVCKSSPDEKVGVVVEIDGQTQIIEYIDLPRELSEARDPDGQLTMRAGNTAIHVFDCEFLERVAMSHAGLPWHQVRRPVSHIDISGHVVNPDHPNGLKSERFIFDVLPLAKSALVFETEREKEFSPLKNAEGEDSPTTVRRSMISVAVNRLRAAGIHVEDGTAVEISPLALFTDEEPMLRQGISLPSHQPLVLGPEHLVPRTPTKSSTERLTLRSIKKTNLGPLRFESKLKPRVWGGRALNEVLGHSLTTDDPYGEAWDISALPEEISCVESGPLRGKTLTDLWANYHRDLVGGRGRANQQFPLLIKWLECHDRLSLQVHPNDQLARQLLNQPYGKSEVWIVLEAASSAKVFAGFRPGVSKQDFLRHLNAGTLEECVHSFTPKPGDCVVLPAGTIHAAGGGLLIAEVQQSSDATFRLHDWNRVGLDGCPRPLQIEHAIQAIDWTQGAIEAMRPTMTRIDEIGTCEEFLTELHAFSLKRYTVTHPWVASHPGELTIWMVLEGSANLSHSQTNERQVVPRGRTILIPASAGEVIWSPMTADRDLKLLCIRIPS